MNLPDSDILTVKEFAANAIDQVRNRVIIVSGMVLIPFLIFFGFYSEYSSISQVLIPLTRQMAQAISLGTDEIALQRITDSLALIPEVSIARVYLEDGTCAAESRRKQGSETWNSSILEPCQGEAPPFEVSLKREIKAEGGARSGYIQIYLKTPWNYMLFLPFALLFLIVVANLFIRLSVHRLIQSFVMEIGSISTAFEVQEPRQFAFKETREVYKNLQSLKLLQLEIATNASLQKAATQVSHDIRSPLSALEMILPSLTELSNEKRIIAKNAVNRIRDIANELLNKYRARGPKTDFKSNTNGVEFLLPIVETLVSEKRAEYNSNPKIEICFRASHLSYGQFSKINSNSLMRVLSNIINNSVEALGNKKGVVEIWLEPQESGRLAITVRDNGIGIPRAKLNSLGHEGSTFNKEFGSGLGLFGAFEFVREAGGQIEINSEVGKGTEVSLILESANPPAWFVPEVVITRGSAIIVLDDDSSIHRSWQNRFSSFAEQINRESILYFSSSSETRLFFRGKFSEINTPLFLIDYDIGDMTENGIDLIEQLGIAESSILVTSRYDDSEVRERCEKMNLKMLPKFMVAFIPIKVVFSSDVT